MPTLDYSRIRPDMIQALERYANDHIQPGGFLTAVLENNLKEALGRADEDNIRAIFHIVGYVYNELPYASQGSPEAVLNWINEQTTGT